jgi:putative hydrolase of HD superfamily
MSLNRLEQQLIFIVEIDKLKNVLRQSYLVDGSRRENSAEHSWHVALVAVVLAEHANESVDLLKVVKMLLIHDVVEVDAGDTFVYDEAAMAAKAGKERAAAERIFGLLPAEPGAELRALWDEYEDAASPEAKYAAAVDRFMPMLHNYHTGGKSWQAHGITAERVLKKNAPIADGAADVWEYAKRMIDDAVKKGFLSK